MSGTGIRAVVVGSKRFGETPPPLRLDVTDAGRIAQAGVPPPPGPARK
jgi:hypothetical protein